jgi:hypothetical protein
MEVVATVTLSTVLILVFPRDTVILAHFSTFLKEKEDL